MMVRMKGLAAKAFSTAACSVQALARAWHHDPFTPVSLPKGKSTVKVQGLFAPNRKPDFRRAIYLVRMKGLEPSRLSALVPKTSVSTIPPHPHVV
jgi:hypothetical protein